MKKKPIIIFIGPMKTGTTWLFFLLKQGQNYDKEIYFPKKWGKSFVYDKYVRDKDILIWPYLLHEGDSLRSLLNELDKRGRDVELVISWRNKKNWRKSMFKFAQRASKEAKFDEIRNKEAEIKDNVEWLINNNRKLSCLRIINPRPKDRQKISEITGISTENIILRENEKVYETTEKARINSRHLGRIYFLLKPFMPKFLRKLRRSSKVFSQIFYLSR